MSEHLEKVKTEVTIQFISGRNQRGFIYATQGSRIQDVVNSDRRFIPFTNTSGTTQLINLDNIESIEPISQENGGKVFLSK